MCKITFRKKTAYFNYIWFFILPNLYGNQIVDFVCDVKQVFQYRVQKLGLKIKQSCNFQFLVSCRQSKIEALFYYMIITPLNCSCTKNKSRIQEAKHLSTNADSSTNTKKILLVRQNLPKKKQLFFVPAFLNPL